MNETRLIVTADDFGLTDEINRGIVTAHEHGIVTSTSLLVNAPATEMAYALSRKYPNLEIGIHLGFVEGFALSTQGNSLTDKLRYLGDRPCLIRHWTNFLSRFLVGRIDLGEIESELEAQIQKFLDYFPSIPFANGTQHLHILPGVRDIVSRLARKYDIGAIRLHHGSRVFSGFNMRHAYNAVLKALVRNARKAFTGIRTTDHFVGFDVCGRLSPDAVLNILDRIGVGTTELMTHPGEDSAFLREKLPWGYSDFDWSGELKALTDDRVRERVRERGIRLIRFADLPTFG
jgi:predicted glycoside hydrolase/deacetylase ChbG (UPF0249 family)